MALSTSFGLGLRYENMMNTLCLAAGRRLEGIKDFQDRRTVRFAR